MKRDYFNIHKNTIDFMKGNLEFNNQTFKNYYQNSYRKTSEAQKLNELKGTDLNIRFNLRKGGNKYQRVNEREWQEKNTDKNPKFKTMADVLQAASSNFF